MILGFALVIMSGGLDAPALLAAAAVRVAVTFGARTLRKPSSSPRLGECMGKTGSIALRSSMREFDFRRKILQVYLHQIPRIWHRLPAFFRLSSPGQAVGKHVHGLVRPCDERRQSFGTFFLRNRAELELLRRLLERKASGSSLDITVLGCSKGAEVYSFLWTIRLARPDLRLRTHAV